MRPSNTTETRSEPPQVKVLCLDLEGTLISTAVSQFPRPFLREFLDGCRQLFERIAIYTSVPEQCFRTIAALLVEEGAAPTWFLDVEYVEWHGPIKDLAFVPEAAESEILLVDDTPSVVHPDQRARWIPVVPFDAPYLLSDDELMRSLQELERRTCGRPTS